MRFEFQAQVGAQLGVERGERLVHQVDRRPAHQRAADGDALHLAAGEPRRRGSSSLSVDAQKLARSPSPARRSRPRARGAAASARGRRDCRRRTDADRASIAGRRRRRRASAGSAAVRSTPPMRMRARIGALEPGDEAKRRRLAGARRAEQDDELAVGDGERQVGDGLDVAEALGDAGRARSQPCAPPPS